MDGTRPPDFTVVVAMVVAVWGAITGTAGLVLSYLNYRRDRANLKVEVSIGHLGEPGGEWEGPFVFVEATNTGRRPVQVREGGLILPTGVRLMITPPARPYNYPLPATLTEADHHKLWTRQEHLVDQLRKRGGVLPTHAYYTDSSGHPWKSKVPDDIKRSLRDALASGSSEV